MFHTDSFSEEQVIPQLHSAINQYGTDWVKIQKNRLPNFKISEIRSLYKASTVDHVEEIKSSTLKHCSSDVCVQDIEFSSELSFAEDCATCVEDFLLG
ncbi:hypothetical protein SS50377_27083 [Spironucleus salmonicida]|uniref:Uncharacterized protein n=1 Tax=Spironucleus salmonicida TaxID=348837 RepID=V6LR60_9EUKA|nr:hypothetical protein SS50377_27083 [Spironucleus salmonicida]|eukprot:EST46728.1 Hypothetical protein SS50377_13243 [Spironucleus salmonicida]